MTDNQQPSLDLRTCRKCGLEKPLTEFATVYSQKSRGKQYKSNNCLDCHRKAHAIRERRRRATNPEVYRDYVRRHYFKHREVKNERRREWSAKLRDIVYAHYGNHCVCCGETEPTMLTLDHVNEDGGSQRRIRPEMRWAKHLHAWLIKNGFPDDMQVLCYNCNISKHRNGGVCAHQIKEGSTTIPKGSRAKRPEVRSTQPLIG